MQLYAVLYEPSGRFLLGYKLSKGYYFFDSAAQTGALVAAGQVLNGAGNYALPGGAREGQEDIAAGAAREFHEETGEAIPTTAQASSHQFSTHYSAGFFQVTANQLNQIAGSIIDQHLPAGGQAKDAVANLTITQYSQIAVQFPLAPLDNELDMACIWDVNDVDCWTAISLWQDDPVIGWYYEILSYLKNTVL